MADKALYVLAGYDNATEMRLAALQNKLYEHGFTGTHTRNIPQHITLGSFPTEKERELTELLQKLSEEGSSFDVTFNHVGIFAGGYVLFIAPDHNTALLKLKENFGDSFDWTAHTTMLIDQPETVCRALPILMEDFTAFQGRVNALHLYEFFPTRHILSVRFAH